MAESGGERMSVTFIIIASAILLGVNSFCLDQVRKGKEISKDLLNGLSVLGLSFAIMLMAIAVRLTMARMGW